MWKRTVVAGFSLVLFACSDSGDDPAIYGAVRAVVIGAVSWGGAVIPLPGVSVTIDGLTSVTNSGGVAYLNQVHQGVRDVRLERAGSVPHTEQVTVFAGDTADFLGGLEPVRPDTGSMRVVVGKVPPTGNPLVEGASVTIAAVSGIADNFGTVILHGVPAGDQPIHVAHSDYVSFDSTVTVFGGETRDIFVALIYVPPSLRPDAPRR